MRIISAHLCKYTRKYIASLGNLLIPLHSIKNDYV